MRHTSFLLSYRILFAVLSASAVSIVKSETRQANSDLSGEQLQQESAEVHFRGDDLLSKNMPEKTRALRQLAQACLDEKDKIAGDLPIEKTSFNEIIRQRNEEQCGQSYLWERAVHTACRYSIHTPFDWASRGLRATGRGLNTAGEHLPWGLRHATKMLGGICKGIGGLTRTVNNTLTLNLPTTVLGRFPTDPIESTFDVPLQIMETTVNIGRHTADTVHTLIQEPVNMIAEPFQTAGEIGHSQTVEQASHQVTYTSDNLLAVATHMPILIADCAVACQKIVLEKSGVSTPWRKSGDLRLLLSEGNALPYKDQFIQAYRSCVQRKVDTELQKQKNTLENKPLLSGLQNNITSAPRLIKPASTAHPQANTPGRQKINE